MDNYVDYCKKFIIAKIYDTVIWYQQQTTPHPPSAGRLKGERTMEFKSTWNDAIAEARRYHEKKMQYRCLYGVDYDEDGAIYTAMPNMVKDALNHLCETGEIQ